MDVATADLYDSYPETTQVCELQFRSFGKRRRFFGECVTLRTHEDHQPVLEALRQDGKGRVLVVDAGGSLRVGVMGDRIAGVAARSGWAGVVIHGAIRDSVAIDQLEIGVKALGATARRGWDQASEAKGGPVTFGSVRFEPGHWVYADEDAVIVSPTSLDFGLENLPVEVAE